MLDLAVFNSLNPNMILKNDTKVNIIDKIV